MTRRLSILIAFAILAGYSLKADEKFVKDADSEKIGRAAISTARKAAADPANRASAGWLEFLALKRRNGWSRTRPSRRRTRYCFVKSENGQLASCRFEPEPTDETIDPSRVYRVAFPPWAIFTFTKYAKVPVDTFRTTDVLVKEALERFWDANVEC